MLVESQDGVCRECGGQLKIIDADDATMTVECCTCGDSYDVETDAFGDGAIHYWPTFMAEQLGEEEGP
jgi:transcription elongation factor Elf1